MIGTLFFGTIALYIASYILNIGIPLTFTTHTMLLALQVSMVLGVLNSTIKPFVKVITLPFHLLSFGLFSFIVNGSIIMLAAKILPSFYIPSFMQAIFFAAIFTLIMRVYHLVASKDDK